MDLLFEATLTADTNARGLNRRGTQWHYNDTRQSVRPPVPCVGTEPYLSTPAGDTHGWVLKGDPLKSHYFRWPAHAS
jgi:hypothetical protein